MVAHKFAELIEALQAEKNRRKTEKSAGKPKHVPPPPNNGLGNNPLDAIQVNQNMRVAQNAAAAAAQKIAAHYLNYSNMLGNAARNSSKQAANMRAKTRNNRRSRRSRRTRR